MPVEDIGEAALDVPDRVFVRVAGDECPLGDIEAAQIIDAPDMIGVGVGEEDRVHTPDARAQGLLPEVGSSVNNDIASVLLYQDGSARALVVLVS